MERALYRKYRPKSLSEVVGQQHVTTTLANAIANNKVGHAYLLTGPRGVGKTSIARILAHQLNNIEYNEQNTHLDIIEIDAASNRRIDEIRDLRDKVHILPAGAKYKVYIIDEVHMLTKEAFNALLKTLEEPPAHVVFILATTEVHKLPETIISRTQHFTFKPIDLRVLATHLETIAKKEKLKIDNDAIELIAIHGDGSFRDGISLLDQARGLAEHITKTEVEKLLGITPVEALQQLVHILDNGSAGELFNLLGELRGHGLQSTSLASQLSDQLRQLLLSNDSYQNQRTLTLLHSLLAVGASRQPDRFLELILLDYIFTNNTATDAVMSNDHAVKNSTSSNSSNGVPTIKPPIKTGTKTNQVSSSTVPPITSGTVVKNISNQAPKKSEKEKSQKNTNTQTNAKPKTPLINPGTSDFDLASWPVILASIKKQYNTLYGILRMATPSARGNVLTLNCRFAFHQKQINESKNRKIINDIIAEQTGSKVEIVCVVDTKASKSPSQTIDNTVANVSDIFGGGEVLES
ncbi:DNA polymerase III subunit gamma/tau [Candidatus Saccharibacteria bacterium]|nr:DNA polymerase III subunit gamma/tau [Candidatus Saccharibacteria bacterium]